MRRVAAQGQEPGGGAPPPPPPPVAPPPPPPEVGSSPPSAKGWKPGPCPREDSVARRVLIWDTRLGEDSRGRAVLILRAARTSRVRIRILDGGPTFRRRAPRCKVIRIPLGREHGRLSMVARRGDARQDTAFRF